MLVLSRKAGERIRVGENITVVVTKIAGNRVTIGIDAPDSMRIVREELPIADSAVAASPPAERAASESPVGPLPAVTLPTSNLPTVDSPTGESRSVESPACLLASASSDANPAPPSRELPTTSGSQTSAVNTKSESRSDDSSPTVVASRVGGPRAPLAKIVRQRNRPQVVNVASRVPVNSDRESHLAGAAQPGETTPSVTEVELSAVQLLSFAITTTF